MGRWGLRQIAKLCVLVWVMAACAPTLPPLPLEVPTTAEATLILRTLASPLATPRSPGTATPAPATPSMAVTSATPAPSATPFYYTVTESDTLARIAERFGVSIAALQAANGDLPARLVYPGQVLLIPAERDRPVTATLARYLLTATPGIQSLPAPACYHTPVDEVVCLGWAANAESAAPLTGITIQVELIDATGQVVTRRAASLPQATILPGQRAAYAVRFQAPPSFASARAGLLGDSLPGEASLPVVPLTVSEPTLTIDGGLIRLAGQVRHAGPTPVGNLLVIGVLYDDADRITGLRIERPEGTLIPGAALAVDMLITPLAVGTTRAALYAEGRLTPAPDMYRPDR